MSWYLDRMNVNKWEIVDDEVAAAEGPFPASGVQRIKQFVPLYRPIANCVPEYTSRRGGACWMLKRVKTDTRRGSLCKVTVTETFPVIILDTRINI